MIGDVYLCFMICTPLFFMSSILYQGGYFLVIEAICSIDVGNFICGLWGMPHDFWCAPLAPNVTFMISSCRMIVAEKKWLKIHLLPSILRQANDALRWFHAWNYISPPFSYKFMLPYVAGGMLFIGSTVLEEGNKLKIPIGSVILPTLHVVCFRRSNG